MEPTRSEDCLIFYGLTPEVTKPRQVYNAIADFMKNKQDIDPSDRFNLIVFLQDGPNYLDHFTFDPDHILKTLKSLSSDITRANIAGGIFIAITFIIEIFKKISEKIFRLVILVDEGAHEIPDDYILPLEELIKTVKDMPFFIDIIRIGKQESKESEKLMKLAKLCNGEFYEINNIRNLDPILTILSEKKYISEPSFIKQKIRMILKDNQPFFINLADEPTIVDEISTCSICFNRDNQGIVKCPSCETVAHKVCWAQWAKTTNIGIAHVFRCHSCFNILKLDEKFVLDVQAGRIPTIAELMKVEKKNIVEYLRELESKSKPKIIHAEDPMRVKITEMPLAEKAGSPIGRKRRRTAVNICPNCSKIITGDKKSCPTCGFILI